VTVTITEDQFRIYYAAYFGDVEMIDNLRILGWNVNGQDYDGRTAIGIAASEGHLNVVKYLISKGADVNIKDARGNDALGDARRENRTEVTNYLVNEALILVYCLDFEQEFFAKGVQQAIGVFNRKFEDLSILINQQPQNTRLYGLLGAS
jgi:ankyrin repeat protein